MAMKIRFLPQKIVLTSLEFFLQHLTHSKEVDDHPPLEIWLTVLF